MSVELVSSISELRKRLSGVRRKGVSIGLVPTMGALHAGHIRLIDRAVKDSDFVVVSLFVNPIQFNQEADYKRYPREVSQDLEVCRERGVDVLFAPSLEEMYPRPQRTFVEVEHLTEHLCGKHRPGHFRGVTSVVLKLLNIVQPERAYFGQKDAQQLAVIRRMVDDLSVPLTIVEVPTVRERDGLALSSRNEHLNAEQRGLASSLHQALQVAGKCIAEGERDVRSIKDQALATIERRRGLRVEYFEIVDPEEMQPVDEVAGPVRVAAAAWVGSTRLIDNVLCEPVKQKASA